MNNKTVVLLQIRDIILPFSHVLTPFMGLLKKIILTTGITEKTHRGRKEIVKA
jgi:hypothetical protein